MPRYLLALHRCSDSPTFVDELLPDDAAVRALVDTVAAEIGRNRPQEDVNSSLPLTSAIHTASAVANDN